MAPHDYTYENDLVKLGKYLKKKNHEVYAMILLQNRFFISYDPQIPKDRDSPELGELFFQKRVLELRLFPSGFYISSFGNATFETVLICSALNGAIVVVTAEIQRSEFTLEIKDLYRKVLDYTIDDQFTKNVFIYCGIHGYAWRSELIEGGSDEYRQSFRTHIEKIEKLPIKFQHYTKYSTVLNAYGIDESR